MTTSAGIGSVNASDAGPRQQRVTVGPWLRQCEFPHGRVRTGAGGDVVQPAADFLPMAAGLRARGKRNDLVAGAGHRPMLPRNASASKGWHLTPISKA